ncbi:putative quinol monooxygenase [Microbacterium sp. SS28]|uniref:putative quinol monooxygenase n=1 Tax=Microbacterium sp. SS28 TaxID=2919948 RepID=UPI001FAAA6B8|nr:putative quinol monooxygenase [Microbacterium sp. SS28]
MTDAHPVVLYAEFTARAGLADRVEELLTALVIDVRQEPGNVVFDAYRVKDAEDRFFVFEVYRDDAAFAAHISAPYGEPFNRALRELIVEDGSQLTFLTPAAEPATA